MNMRQWLKCAALGIVAALAFSAAPATTKPAGEPAPDDFVISKMRVQQFKGNTYLYSGSETTFARLGPTIDKAMTLLLAAIKQNHVDVKGAPIFVYKGIGMDRSKPFHMEIGFPVAEETKPAGELKIRTLAPITCATVLYSGPSQGISGAYGQLFGDLFSAGLQPSGENRETYLLWESPESVNNVVLIQVGLR